LPLKHLLWINCEIHPVGKPLATV